jgi:hypothetical protein
VLLRLALTTHNPELSSEGSRGQWPGDPAMVSFSDAVVLKTFGEVPEKLDEL